MDDDGQNRAFLFKRAFWALHLELGVPREARGEFYGPGLTRGDYRGFARHPWARGPSFTVPFLGGHRVRVS
ncbi:MULTISPECIES: hypothetical protein, partial [unclassified Nocardiopsis]